MNEKTIMVPYLGERNYFDVVTLPGVTFERGKNRILAGDVCIFWKGANVPWLCFDLIVDEDADAYLRSDSIWWHLCNVAMTGRCPICRKKREICHSKRLGMFVCVDCHFDARSATLAQRSGASADADQPLRAEPLPNRRSGTAPFTHRDSPLQAA